MKVIRRKKKAKDRNGEDKKESERYKGRKKVKDRNKEREKESKRQTRMEIKKVKGESGRDERKNKKDRNEERKKEKQK